MTCQYPHDHIRQPGVSGPLTRPCSPPACPHLTTPPALFSCPPTTCLPPPHSPPTPCLPPPHCFPAPRLQFLLLPPPCLPHLSDFIVPRAHIVQGRGRWCAGAEAVGRTRGGREVEVLTRVGACWGRVRVRACWGRVGVRACWGRVRVRACWGRVRVRACWGRVRVRACWGKVRVRACWGRVRVRARGGGA